ncbi:MAG: hypothetical protein Q8P67_11490 [archaeon]|nr:hypothetical protein [archaeon]
MTNVCKRPTPSEIGPSVRQVILGFGIDGYRLALQAIARSLGSIPTE